MPDIDVDFCFERRGEVIEYVRERYGRDSVGQIVTFGTMKARAAVKDVARVLRIPPGEADRITKLIPSGPAYSLTIREAVEKVDELRELVKSNPGLPAAGRPELADRRDLAATCRCTRPAWSSRRARSPSTCRCAPRRPRAPAPPADGEDAIITQYEMGALEKVGMLKMDMLGLKTLTVIHDAVQMIAARHGRGPRHGRAAVRRPGGVRAAAAGPHRGRLPVRVAARHRHAAGDEVRPVRRPGRLQRAAPPRPARRRACTRSSSGGSWARRRSAIPHPSLRGGAGADLRRHHLPGTGDADRQRARRLHAGRSRRAPEGGGQEGRGADQEGAGQVRRAGGGPGPPAEAGRGAGRADRDLRPLRLQQVALGGLLGPLLPDRLAQGALPRRVHGGAALLGNRQHRQGGAVHQRGAGARARGAAARRERVGLQVHRGGRAADPLRAGRGAERRLGRDRVDHRRAAATAPFTDADRPGGADRPPALQQAGARVAGRRRRLRLAGRPPQAS